MSIWIRIGEALAALGAGEGLAAVFDRLRTPPERSVGFAIAVIALGAKLHLLQPPQRPQPHVEDRLRLHLAQPRRLAFQSQPARRDIVPLARGPWPLHAPVLGHQRGLRLVVIADDVDHPVKIQEGRQKPLQHLQPMVDLLQPVARPPLQHVAAMVQKGAKDLLQRTDLRRQPVDQHVEVQREANLQVRIAKQHPHQHSGVHRPRPGLEHDAHILRALVAHIRQKRHLLRGDDLGQPLDQPPLLHLIGYLGHHDLPRPPPKVLDPPARAQPKRPPPRAISLHNARARLHQHPAGREIRPRHKVEQRLLRRLRMPDQMQAGRDQLVEVMRRDIRRHPHRDAR